MKNEPVAWMSNGKEFYVQKNYCPDFIPLYTHPVNPYQSITNTKIEPTVVSYTHPVKELTDEEILECWNETHPAVVCLNAELPLFARAILRKAQEK